MSTGKGKGRKEAWDGEAHKALAVALFRTHGTFVLEQQAAVVKDMNDNGTSVILIYLIDFHFFNPLNLPKTFTPPSSIITILPKHTSPQDLAITMSTPTKSAKKWDDTMNSHLFLSICEVLKLSFSQEHKNAIVEMMTRRFGHDVNWNGIR
ncbi:hypothetical protein F5Y09DRAFT_343105 [Xylaria sp. FL1042]|nr:hypothetical protein F5Y09DRAFT_343105 [Xylaria sp. FL1042]